MLEGSDMPPLLLLMLFMLAMDMLNSLISHVATSGILKHLTSRHAVSNISLYPGDVFLFYPPDHEDLAAIREILRVFDDTLGMRTNFAKCPSSPIQCSIDQTVAVANIIACPHQAVPHHLPWTPPFGLQGSSLSPTSSC